MISFEANNNSGSLNCTFFNNTQMILITGIYYNPNYTYILLMPENLIIYSYILLYTYYFFSLLSTWDKEQLAKEFLQPNQIEDWVVLLPYRAQPHLLLQHINMEKALHVRLYPVLLSQGNNQIIYRRIRCIGNQGFGCIFRYFIDHQYKVCIYSKTYTYAHLFSTYIAVITFLH